MEKDWIIWSVEHQGWWREESRGYTKSRRYAGVYSFKEACKIVRDANRLNADTPNEAMVRVYEYES